MALATRIKSPEWQSGDTLNASDLIAEFNNLVNAINGSNDLKGINGTFTGTLAVTGTSTFTGNTTAAQLTLANVDVSKALVPIGSIIPHYDFDANLTPDSTYWKYCNGQSTDVGGTTETLPDLTGRYLVGFGTGGDANIEAVAWATDAVGNTAHQIDVSHTHTGPSHTHTGPSHNHAWFSKSTGTTGGTTYYSNGSSQSVVVDGVGGATEAYVLDATSAGKAWYTNKTGTGATGASGTGSTGSAGSATQSIQPESLPVRYIMRVK